MLTAKVNLVRVLGRSPGAFCSVIDLTNAISKDLSITDYRKELLVLLVGAHEEATYEWEQHVSIAQDSGVRQAQFIAVAEDCLEDTDTFNDEEWLLLRFGK